MLFSLPKIFSTHYPPVFFPHLFHLKQLFPSLRSFFDYAIYNYKPLTILSIVPGMLLRATGSAKTSTFIELGILVGGEKR